MNKTRLVPFISDGELIVAVKKVVDKTREAKASYDADKNVLDAFSAVYEAAINGVAYDQWVSMEGTRQIQKTMQNAIGAFHQEVIGHIDGWENLGIGQLVDVRNKSSKIIAEVKNKYNTVKGSDLVQIYDELRIALSRPEHIGFTAFYVMMITKNRNHLKAFVPPDRTTKQRRPEREQIKEISGFKFYEMITGIPNALFLLFSAIPKILQKEYGLGCEDLRVKENLEKVFYRTYRDLSEGKSSD